MTMWDAGGVIQCYHCWYQIKYKEEYTLTGDMSEGRYRGVVEEEEEEATNTSDNECT